MCYFNGQVLPKDQTIRLRQFEQSLLNIGNTAHPVISGFDYGQSLVLIRNEEGEGFVITPMEWGFIPHYLKNRGEVDKMRKGFKEASGKWKPPFLMLNAKGEELLLPGKVFREAALHRRCLVLSTGFFEWRHEFPVNKKTGIPAKTARKYPYFISLQGKSYFFMAGIWQAWTDRETGEHVKSFAIVTTNANHIMSQIHNSQKRMPLILSEELAYEWLLEDLDEKRISELVRFQYPDKEFNAYTIGKEFRTADNPMGRVEYKELSPVSL